ncbi:MAG TPA: hypothetical protein VF950_17415 [Planctomycetota bacterium]
MKTAALAVALGLSLLGNVVLLTRLRGREEPRAPAAAAPRAPERPAPVPAVDVPSEDVVRPEAPAAVAAPAPPPLRTSTPAPSAIRDPLVLGVIQAQEDFGAFWKELDRVFKARAKLEESRYAQTVVGAVQDFLGLSDAARPGFDLALRGAARQLADTRKEYELARQGLPPKDKANPAYQQQKDALDARYQERTASIVDGVKAHLDLKDPRHGELAGSLDRLLRNLAPRP